MSKRDMRTRGSILVPCVFLLSLMSLIALGVLNAGGVGGASSAALASRSQARLAAVTGVEIGYRRLAEDLEYTGETSTPLDNPNVGVDITVTALGNYEFDVLSVGTDGTAVSEISARALARQWVFNYPLSIGKDLTWKGTSRILGDCYVKSKIQGTTTAKIKGDLYLSGPRTILYDGMGVPLTIDGYTVPTITGDVFDCAPEYDFPTIDLAVLRAQAAAAGTVYSGFAFFYNQNLEGLIYVENCFPLFWNVTINGTLVCDGVPWIQTQGYLKIRCDDDVCQNVAIIAPNT
jgi:hypothetical protein